MELFRRIFGERRKESKWDYDYLREYLLALTRGREFLLPAQQYPKGIELAFLWQFSFEMMRFLSANDGNERWKLIGFKDDRRALYLPLLPVEGLSHYVPSETIDKAIRRAQRQFYISYLLGTIHSHPKTKEELSLQHFQADEKRSNYFSVSDLHHIVIPGRFWPITVVVSGCDNLVAFKTRDTIDIPQDSPFLDGNNFCRFWYEKFGYEFTGDVERGQETIRQVRTGATIWDINLGIAKEYGLVLYRSFRVSPLERVYPA